MVFKKKKKKHNTNTILSNGKFGIGYARRVVPDAILTIESVWYWVVPDIKSNIESYCHRLPAVIEYPRLNLKSNSSYYVKTVK